MSPSGLCTHTFCSGAVKAILVGAFLTTFQISDTSATAHSLVSSFAECLTWSCCAIQIGTLITLGVLVYWGEGPGAAVSTQKPRG